MAYWHIGGERRGHRESVRALRAADLWFLSEVIISRKLIVLDSRGEKNLIAGHCGVGSALLIDGSSQ